MQRRSTAYGTSQEYTRGGSVTVPFVPVRTMELKLKKKEDILLTVEYWAGDVTIHKFFLTYLPSYFLATLEIYCLNIM